PRGFANELAARFIFADESPFSRPLHGYSATVVGLTREDVQGFHAATYSPQGAALVVAGNLDPSAVLETAEAAFGAWSGPTVPQQVAPVTPRDQGVRVVIVDRAGAVQSEIRVGHIGVARNTPDFFAIAVMN